MASKKVYQEVYTANDILSCEFVNVNVRGYKESPGVRLFLKNKIGKRTRFGYKHEGVEHDRHVPFEGGQVLEEGGYVVKENDEMDDGVPLPPWCDNGDTTNTAEQSRVVVHGPIITFVIPNLSHPDQMEAATKRAAPPLLWKVQFPPDPSIALEAFTILDGSLDVHPDPNASERFSVNGSCAGAGANGENDNESYSDSECDASHPTNIYINGYQSWSFTGSMNQGDVQPTSAMPDFLSKAFNQGAEVPPMPTEEATSTWMRNDGVCDGSVEHEQPEKERFQHSAFYKSDFYTCVSCNEVENGRDLDECGKNKVDEMGGPAMVLGFLSQRRQYGLITFDSDLGRVAMHASLQGVVASRLTGITTDWGYCQILPGNYYDEEPMGGYLNAVSSYNRARPLQSFPPLTGWCSWYHYYEVRSFLVTCL